ncbi:MAG: YafY family transcriptional regulator [Chloroflexia bacterium]|nr:YafY family transcriptional regulator [Chloroflexia bacterium]
MENKSTTRLSRLTAILTQLQTKRLITARELAEKHSVSIRTIYRDIRALEQSGIPIATEEGLGYSLVEGYKLSPVSFSEQEANALITAEHLVARNKDESFVRYYKDAITKIKAVLRYEEKEKAELLSNRIQFRNNPENDITSNHLSNLQYAITNFKLTEIEYNSLQNELTARKVEPFAMYSTQDNWLLIAYCRLRKDFRAFRLDRIEKLTILSENFKPHKMTLLEFLKNAGMRGDGESRLFNPENSWNFPYLR